MSRGYRVFSDHEARRFVELRAGLRRLGVRALAALPVFVIGAHFADGMLRDVLLAAGRGTAWAGVLAIGASMLVRFFEGGRAGAVQVAEGERPEDDEVELPGRARTRVKLRELREGWAREERSLGQRVKRAVVELVTREGDVWSIRVPSLDAGLVLLAALGLDARQRTMRFDRPIKRVGVGVGAAVVGSMLGFVSLRLYADAVTQLGSSIGFVTLPAVFAGIWTVIRRIGAPGPLEIGADGVAWTSSTARSDATFRQRLVARLRGHRRHVVRWRDVKHANAQSRVLWLETTTEGFHRIPLGAVDPEVEAMIRRRIDDARERESSSESLALFEPGARTFSEWVANLRALEDPKGYRGAAIPKVRVIETLEDPDAPSARRLGAALALVHADDEATRALGRHLARDAAASLVDPELAEAFAAIAEERVDEKKLMRVATAER